MLRHLTEEFVHPAGPFAGRWVPREPPLASPRKLRLFACAVVRAVWPLLADPRSRRAVEVAERFADGLVDAGVLHVAHGDARSAWEERDNAAGLACYASTTGDVADAVSRIVRRHLIDVPPPAAQAALLRDIIGNPWRPARLPGPPCPWLTPQVVSLATAAYLERGGETCGRCGGKWKTVQGWTTVEIGGRWTKCPDCAGEGRVATTGHLDAARLAVLADALEDSGATDAQLLGHLRSPGPHVRGCVAVDLILGKT